MGVRTGWALVGRTSPSLKLGAALCTRGTDYEGMARGCSGCKMTPWKWSCKMQVNNQQVPVRINGINPDLLPQSTSSVGSPCPAGLAENKTTAIQTLQDP